LVQFSVTMSSFTRDIHYTWQSYGQEHSDTLIDLVSISYLYEIMNIAQNPTYQSLS